jgi:hypothetical protein
MYPSATDPALITFFYIGCGFFRTGLMEISFHRLLDSSFSSTVKDGCCSWLEIGVPIRDSSSNLFICPSFFLVFLLFFADSIFLSGLPFIFLDFSPFFHL